MHLRYVDDFFSFCFFILSSGINLKWKNSENQNNKSV